MRTHQKEADITVWGKKIHVRRVGDGEGNFVCLICHEQFPVANRLKNHIESKHPGVPYPPVIG